jgi:Fe-S cluster assembly protein SufD
MIQKYGLNIKVEPPTLLFEQQEVLTFTDASNLPTIIHLQHKQNVYLEYTSGKHAIHITSTAMHDMQMVINTAENTNLEIVLLREHVGALQLVINAKGFCKVTAVDIVEKYAKLDVVVNLLAKGADVQTHVVSCAYNAAQYDLYTESRHIAAHSTSKIICKAVAVDTAKTIARSLIRIEKDAAGSTGYEKQEGLLLSPNAEVDAIPNLEIHNYDVKCSHGSTIGRINEDKLYYMMSRGLSKKQAIASIVLGYFHPILMHMPNSEDIINKIKEKLADE